MTAQRERELLSAVENLGKRVLAAGRSLDGMTTEEDLAAGLRRGARRDGGSPLRSSATIARTPREEGR